MGKNVKIEFSTISLNFPYVSACFPLVSDGPMVRDLCNRTKRKAFYRAFTAAERCHEKGGLSVLEWKLLVFNMAI